MKQRLVGATVIVAAAVIFLPMLLDGPGGNGANTRALEIPPRPEANFESRLLPVDPDSADAGEVVEPPPVLRHPSPTPDQVRDLETDLPDAGDGGTNASDPPSESVPERVAESDQGAAGEAASGSGPEVAGTPVAQPVSAVPPAAAGSNAETRVPEPRLSGWVVQVGWFSGEDNARSLRDRLRSAGFTAFMETDVVGGKPGFRVRVGPELERADANALRERLKEALGVEGIVMAHP